MKLTTPNYRLQSQNKHLLDILSQNYYLELGVVDVKLITKLLKGYQLNLSDLIYFDLANEGSGQITKYVENDIFYQVNYLVGLRQRSSTDKFFLTCSAIRYMNELEIETYAPVVLIPIEIDYHNFKVAISGEAIVNQLLLHYLSKLFTKSGERNIDTLDAFVHPKLNSFESIDKYSQNLAKRCGLKQIVYNYITVAKVEYHDYVVDANFFDSERSIYELKPEVITKEFYSKIKAVLPTNIYQKYVLLKVESGQNFAVNGKLGSGKTYTALNIIADQLAKGKRILYVNQDIDNLYEMEKNLNILGLDSHIYNFTRNLNKVEIPKVTYPDASNQEFDFQIIDNLEKYGSDYEINVHGFTKKKIYEKLAVLKRNNPGIKPITIEKDLEYFEVRKCYQNLQDVERSLHLIDPYEKNCWKNVTVFHKNITSNEIVTRIKELENINTKLTTAVEAFDEKYKLKMPNSINDLYMLTVSVIEFDKNKPLKTWVEPKNHLQAKIAIKELQNLFDIYYDALDYYEKNIIKDYEQNKAENLLNRLYYKHLNLDDGTKVNDEIYINRLLLEKSKVLEMINSITTVSNKVQDLNQKLCEKLNVNFLEEYMYTLIADIYTYLSNYVVIKNWFQIYSDSISALMSMYDKAKSLRVQIENSKKVFAKYLVKEEYANFAMVDDVAKSISFNRLSKRYFNLKLLKLDHITYDYIFNIYQEYYHYQLELNHLIVDMGQIKKYSAEYQYESFIAFCEYVRKLSKNESRLVKGLFSKCVIGKEDKLEETTDQMQHFLISCLEIDDIIKKLAYFKIVPVGKTKVLLRDLIKWNNYLKDVIKVNSELEIIFKNNTDVNYERLLKLHTVDKQVENVYQEINKKKSYFEKLLGESYIGIETDVTALSRLMEYFELFCDRFENLDDVDQIYDEIKFKQMVEDTYLLNNLYYKWYSKFKSFSICFKGGQAGLQLQTFAQNKLVIDNFIRKIYQIDDVLFITDSICTFEKYGLADLVLGLRSGRYKKQIAERYLYSTLCKYQEMIEAISNENYTTDEFLENLNIYNQFEKDYCTINIQQLKKLMEYEKKNNTKLMNVHFNKYNHFINLTEHQRFIFLSDLNIFNMNLNLADFDLVIIDDGHLSSANKYNRIKECQQVVIFGDKTFHSSILNILMQRIKDSSIVDFHYRYISMSSKFNNPMMNNNHYILSSKIKVMVDRIADFNQFVKNVIDVYYENTNQLINIIVGNEDSRRIIYSKLVEQLTKFYSEQEIIAIFGHKIKIINFSNETGCYVETVFFYYDDFLEEEVGSKELLFKNFTSVKKQIFINYTENKNENTNEQIEHEIQHLMIDAKKTKKASGIVELVLADLKKHYIRATAEPGFFDIIIKGSKITGIIIKGKESEFIYSNIHEFNYYYTEYQRFGYQVLIINIEDLISKYNQTIDKIIALCKK